MKVLITGGASGLGREITILLAKNDKNRVFFTFNKSKKLAQELESNFPNTKRIKCNFEKGTDINNLLHFIKENDIDLFINNAISRLSVELFQKQSPKNILSSFKINVLSTVIITREVLKKFRAKRGGKILTILTSYLKDGSPTGLSIYTAEKAYLDSLSKSWSRENENFNVQVYTVYPKPIDTNLQKIFDARFTKTRLQKADKAAKEIIKALKLL